jgi:hypothetical protein
VGPGETVSELTTASSDIEVEASVVLATILAAGVARGLFFFVAAGWPAGATTADKRAFVLGKVLLTPSREFSLVDATLSTLGLLAAV